MEASRIYLQPMGLVLDTINDIVELQKGKLTFSNTPNGEIHFCIKMYGFKWELRFTITDIGKNRCTVEIEVDGEKRGREKLIIREFALLDAMLVGGAQIELRHAEV